MKTIFLKSLLFFTLSFFLVLNNGAVVADEGKGSGGETTELPVFATDASAGFNSLIAAMKGKKLMLLGDATHGTEEYYSFRKRVTRHLIRNHGVRALVLEAEWDSAARVDRYIRHEMDPSISAREMLIDAFYRWPHWIWANEELVEFVEWLKLYNSTLAPQQMVHCYGMDMQMAVTASLEELHKTLSEMPEDESLLKKVEELQLWWQPYIADPHLLKEKYSEGTEPGSLLATELLVSLSGRSLQVEQLLKMLIAVEDYYQTMGYDEYGAWNIRASYFADYVLELLKTQAATGGIVVWAHNSHVGDMRSTGSGEGRLLNLGQLVRERIGEDNVFILGSAGYEGTVLAARDWGLEMEVMDVPPADANSVEALLYSGGWKNPLLLFTDPEDRKAWATLFLHRGIGVAYQAEHEHPDNYLTAVISARYDALVFWRETRALQPISLP